MTRCAGSAGFLRNDGCKIVNIFKSLSRCKLLLGGIIARKTREEKTRRKKKVVKKPVSANLLKDKRLLYAAIAIVVIVLAGWRLTTFMIPSTITDTTTQQGSGLAIVAGDTVNVEYTGILETGEEFDSGELEFEMGSGQMIAGFEEAILGMENGEEKTFTIPPEKAYGPSDPTKTQEFPLKRTVNKSIGITADEFRQTMGEDPVEGEEPEGVQTELIISINKE